MDIGLDAADCGAGFDTGFDITGFDVGLDTTGFDAGFAATGLATGLGITGFDIGLDAADVGAAEGLGEAEGFDDGFAPGVGLDWCGEFPTLCGAL